MSALSSGQRHPFEMKFLLRLLRSHASGAGSSDIVDREVACCLGEDVAFAARSVSDRLGVAIAHLSPRMGHLAADGPNYTEALLLSTYDSVRSGDENQAADTALILMSDNTDRARRLVDDLSLLGRLFQRQSGDTSLSHLIRFRDLLSGHPTPADLPPATEATLLFATRTWVAARRAGKNPVMVIGNATTGCLPANAIHALHGLFENVGNGARRGIEIGCVCHGRICEDERQLLHAIATLQEGDHAPAWQLLREWQQPSAARLWMDLLQALAQIPSALGYPEAGDHTTEASNAHRPRLLH